MSGRIFQHVVLQLKETTDRVIGVIDTEGTVVACSELSGIGKKWPEYVPGRAVRLCRFRQRRGRHQPHGVRHGHCGAEHGQGAL